MQREDLTATRFLTSRLAAGATVVAGLYVAFRPHWLGWGALERAAGGEVPLLAVAVGFVLVLVGALSFEKHRVRVRVAEMTEALHQLLYGKDYHREREAVEILLEALESDDAERADTAHRHLVRLTGQHFARDPRVWRAWWAANRRTFERQRSGPGGGSERPERDGSDSDGPDSDGPGSGAGGATRR
jgi:hypothetical protein